LWVLNGNTLIDLGRLFGKKIKKTYQVNQKNLTFAPEMTNLAPALYQELLKINAHPDWDSRGKLLALSELFNKLFFEATKTEQIAFSTLFARISYTGHKYNLQPETLRLVHFFRKIAEKVRYKPTETQITEKDLQLGLRAVAETILVLSGAAFPPEILEIIVLDHDFVFTSPEIWDYKAHARVIAVRDDIDNFCLICVDEENPTEQVRVRYNIPDRNDNFNRSIQSIRKTFGFPVSLNLLEVDIDRHGEYRPRVFVIEPDFLIDVSAISECFKADSTEPLTYLAKKFLPFDSTPAILLGNIANHFLDRLLNEPTVEWRTLIFEIFQLYPFAFVPMSDQEVKDITNKSQKHFVTIRDMAINGFAKQDIDPQDCFLEPTFFSDLYGIQGRLDLFYKTEERAAIVELKGGSVFQPNKYGISRSHFTQTLLYDLLIRSVYGKLTDPAKYILYSAQEKDQLRFAPTIPSEQWEALQLRNQLVSIERRLASIQPGEEIVPMLQQMNGRVDGGKGFMARDFGIFEGVYSALSVLEKKYFNSFVGFNAREQILAKIGQDNLENVRGMSTLWRSNRQEKEDSFAILSNLEIIDNQANMPDSFIVFRKTELTNPLANFRKGDIAVMYPAETEEETVMDSQVIKCTIVALEKSFITVQLRFRQFNLNPFQSHEFWNLEPDMMERGFDNMHRGLFEWATAKPEKRNLLLTEKPPQKPENAVFSKNSISEMGLKNNLTEEQVQIFQKIIDSKDYFLLWGPPGTGKTSVMLRALAQHWLQNTEDNILLLAYTNRAVDEICEALESIVDLVDTSNRSIKDIYLRIGSRHATAEKYRDQLLSQKISKAQKRSELKLILEKHRIFVGTVSSFAQNDGVLRLKKFQRLLVDEASQLLEPQLLGLLSRFNHFVLIGDHRQLPAISIQSAESSIVKDDQDLHSIGLTDLRDSYFERLFRRCESQGWGWAYARLSHQGRMHQDIMAFPNEHFYGGFLKTLPKLGAVDLPPIQEIPLVYDWTDFEGDFSKKLLTQRVIYLPTPPISTFPGQKTNAAEADIVANLTLFFKNLYEKNNLPWHANTLGIITPWRAQIAQIKAAMANVSEQEQSKNPDSSTSSNDPTLNPDDFSIDTVERYQGGARDIILISTCVNSVHQLQSLISISSEGVDRKLNVALTRARKQVILIGNPRILASDGFYSRFMELYG
jgi:DNA replication ATP-dependent helicase Dna2